jgi:putative endonuclease
MVLYILYSDIAGRHYIGITSDLDARLTRHNNGEVRSSKAYRPWRVVHFEKYEEKTEARKREIFLKKTAGARKALYEQIHSGPIV